MTNEELIAQARELVENQVAYFNRRCEEIPLLAYVSDEEMWQLTANLNSWLTHKAEFEEHKLEQTSWTEGVTESWGCFKCETYEPCDFIVTKAKRLLGE